MRACVYVRDKEKRKKERLETLIAHELIKFFISSEISNGKRFFLADREKRRNDSPLFVLFFCIYVYDNRLSK